MSARDNASGAAPLAAVEEVRVQLTRGEALAGVSLEIRRGEIVTIIGPNGAGKTTLLRVLLGLLVPASGRVVLAPGVRIGYMPQRIQIDTVLPLSVKRFLTLTGRRSDTDLRRVLAEVGALGVIDSPVQGLSGGEMQRVLLAKALLRNPDLLVLDEPVQGVDVQGQVELFGLIGRLRQERGCAVLMVSHDLHLVMAATDRVVCLNRHVCCTGTPESVQGSQAFVELFSPQAVANLAVYAHQHDHRHDPVSGRETDRG
jgi:zinc transport system ATP-binding protein